MNKKKLISVIATVLCMAMFFAMPCDAANISNHTSFKGAPDYSLNGYNFCSMQGMAVDQNYVYTAKLAADSNNTYENNATFTRTSIATGEQILFKNPATGKSYFPRMGHINDMCVTTIRNRTTLYVTSTNNANSNRVNLSRLHVDGNRLFTDGYYEVHCNGKRLAVTGIAIYSETLNDITFLFRSGVNVYIGSISKAVGTGIVNAKKVFELDKTFVSINGRDENMSNFDNQGIDFFNNKLYFAVSGKEKYNKGNTSAVLVYENIIHHVNNNLVNETVLSSRNTSFKIVSSKYKLFEIEGCGIRPGYGTVFFNTNRRYVEKNGKTNAKYDGIHYFNGYSAY